MVQLRSSLNDGLPSVVAVPLLRNPAERRLLVELRGLLARGAELAVRGHASGEEVVHQAGLDLLRLGDQRLGLLDGLVDRREDLGDAVLLRAAALRSIGFARASGSKAVL